MGVEADVEVSLSENLKKRVQIFSFFVGFVGQ